MGRKSFNFIFIFFSGSGAKVGLKLVGPETKMCTSDVLEYFINEFNFRIQVKILAAKKFVRRRFIFDLSSEEEATSCRINKIMILLSSSFFSPKAVFTINKYLVCNVCISWF